MRRDFGEWLREELGILFLRISQEIEMREHQARDRRSTLGRAVQRSLNCRRWLSGPGYQSRRHPSFWRRQVGRLSSDDHPSALWLRIDMKKAQVNLNVFAIYRGLYMLNASYSCALAVRLNANVLDRVLMHF